MMTGSVAYLMLGVTDLDRSITFYTETLGRAVKFRVENLVFIDAGSIVIGLNTGLARRRQPVAGAMEIVFSVDGVKALHRSLAAQGVEFLVEPRQATEKDWSATFLDPDGHYLTLFGPPGE
jgi:lactoylglutathione lyase